MRIACCGMLALIFASTMSGAAPGANGTVGPSEQPMLREIAAAPDAAQLQATVQALVGFGTRHSLSDTRSPKRGIGAARRWVQARFEAIGRDCGGCLTVVTPSQTFTGERAPKPAEFVDVVAIQRGTTDPERVIILTGHIDSRVTDIMNATSDAPGADDDASGIATLTEVLRVLLAKDFRPARTLVFMAYAAEEIGLRGSQAIAKDYTKRGINVIGALQLDMTNYQGSDKDIWLMKDFTDAKQNAFVTALIDRYVGATWGLDACGYACSDHASWYRAGVPASMPFESRMKQYNRSIHTNADTLERSNNNADHAIKFARLGAAYAIELAKGDVPRAPVPADDSSKWKLSALALLALAGLISRRMV